MPQTARLDLAPVAVSDAAGLLHVFRDAAVPRCTLANRLRGARGGL